MSTRKNDQIANVRGGGVGVGTDDPFGLQQLTALLAELLATMYEIAKDPTKLRQHTQSDTLLALAREVKELREACVHTEGYIRDLALVAMSDEMGRK